MAPREIPVHQPTLDALAAVDPAEVWARLTAELENAEANEAPSRRRLRELVATLEGKTDALRALGQLMQVGRTAKNAHAVQLSKRRARDRALFVLHIRHGWSLTDCYRPYEIGRHKLTKAFRRMSGEVPRWSEKEAKGRADRAHDAYVEALSIADTARRERDRLGYELASRVHDGVKLASAEISRRGSITSARNAQIGTGSSNRTRAAREAAERGRLRRDDQPGSKVPVAV